MNKTKKIGLGTVQWGTSYGISNIAGQTKSSEVGKIMQLAQETGICFLDTAHAYGNAEDVIGIQNPMINSFNITTKTKPLDSKNISKNELSEVKDAFNLSFDKLNHISLHGLLVHDAENLLVKGSEGLWHFMQHLKSANKVKKIGVSVYEPSQLEMIIEKYDIDIVQFPFNIYDQRFNKNNLIERLQEKMIEIHVRSAFLQGLLLLKPDNLPKYFDSIRKHHEMLYKTFQTMDLSPLEACLLFCLELKAIDKVIVGCENIKQLKEMIQAVKNNTTHDFLQLSTFKLEDEGIIMPMKWQS